MSTQKSTNAPEWVTETLSGLPDLLTVAEVCATLRCAPRTVYRYIDRGRLKGVRPQESGSSKLLIPRGSVGKFLTSLEGTA